MHLQNQIFNSVSRFNST